MNGFIDPYQNTTEGAEISFRCNPMFIPSTRMTATCTSCEFNGKWTPDPSDLTCTCEYLYYTISHIPGPSPGFVIGENLGTGLCTDTPGVGSAKFIEMYF